MTQLAIRNQKAILQGLVDFMRRIMQATETLTSRFTYATKRKTANPYFSPRLISAGGTKKM